MNYFKSKYTNKIIAGNFARCLNYVYGENTISRLIESGGLIEIESPTVEECIMNGGGSVAVVRYRELNPDASWEYASMEVQRIRKLLKEAKTPEEEDHIDRRYYDGLVAAAIETISQYGDFELFANPDQEAVITSTGVTLAD